MKILSALFMILVVVSTTDAKIEIDRVCEIHSYHDYGNGEVRGGLNTGLVINSDDKYLYIITRDWFLEDTNVFKWTNKTREFIDEEKEGELELEGELIDKRLGFALFRTERPENYNPGPIKFDKPKVNEKVTAVVKDYHIHNKINRYKKVIAISGKEDEAWFTCLVKNPPIGGGVLFNEEGSVVGLIHHTNTRTNIISGPHGKWIEKFLTFSKEDNNKVPPAPIIEE